MSGGSMDYIYYQIEEEADNDDPFERVQEK